MKYALFLFLLFAGLAGRAQADSANLTITVKLPVKALVIYGSNISDVPTWSERKTPDALLPLIGTGTKPDSVVTITAKSGQLFSFISRLLSERYGVINTVATSILNNSPAITGYTALTTQVVTIANGNTSEKAAATYLVNRYNDYTNSLTAMYNQVYQKGLDWIRN